MAIKKLHTSAPWIVQGNEIVGPHGESIARAGPASMLGRSIIELQANLALLKTAPQLLAALEKIDQELRQAWEAKILPAEAVSRETIVFMTNTIAQANGIDP